MTRHEQKLLAFVKFAVELAQLSTCKRRAVGCVVAPLDLTQVYSIGYNGVPRGIPNDACTGEKGCCQCCHAEANCLVKLSTRSPSLMITTTSPCIHCAGLVLNTPSIEVLYYVTAWSDRLPLDRLEVGGVRTVQLHLPEGTVNDRGRIPA